MRRCRDGDRCQGAYLQAEVSHDCANAAGDAGLGRSWSRARVVRIRSAQPGVSNARFARDAKRNGVVEWRDGAFTNPGLHVASWAGWAGVAAVLLWLRAKAK